VVIGGSYVNSARFEFLAIFGQRATKGFVPSQQVQQGYPGILWRHMLNNEDRRGNVCGKRADQFVQRFQHARRGPDGDDVPACRPHTASTRP